MNIQIVEQRDLPLFDLSVFDQSPRVCLLHIKPGFHYPSWRPELMGDWFPLPVNSASGNQALDMHMHMWADPADERTMPRFVSPIFPYN